VDFVYIIARYVLLRAFQHSRDQEGYKQLCRLLQAKQAAVQTLT